MIVSPVPTSIDFKHGLRDALIDFLADNDPRIAVAGKVTEEIRKRETSLRLERLKKKKKKDFFSGVCVRVSYVFWIVNSSICFIDGYLCGVFFCFFFFLM